MQEMGYGNSNLCCFQTCEDIERTHIHIVTVGVGLDGKRYRTVDTSPFVLAICRIGTAVQCLYGGKAYGERAGHSRSIDYKAGDVKSQIASVNFDICQSVRIYRFERIQCVAFTFNITWRSERRTERAAKMGWCIFALNGQGEKPAMRNTLWQTRRIGNLAGTFCAI